MNTPPSETMVELRRQFAAQLTGRISAIREQHNRLAEAGWVTTEAQTLHRLVHGLTGAAGAFGMPALSSTARHLGMHLARHLRAGSLPDNAVWAELAAGVDRLQQLARTHIESSSTSIPPSPNGPRNNRGPLIYLVEDDTEQAAYLSRIMIEAGYRVQTWNSADTFRAAMIQPDTERPAAVVMDMVFPEGDDIGAILIEEFGLGRNTGIPVVMVSVLDDLQTRLRAFRAGVCRYLTKPVQAEALADLLEVLTGNQPATPYRVLLVDDDPLLLETHAAILRGAGMNVLTLSKPLLTLDRVDSFRPDVLLLDVDMPEVSGPELAVVLRERDEYLHLPILLLSAETDTSQQLLAISLGGDDFITMPIRPEYLIAAVSARARRARQSIAIRQRLQATLYEREREHLALDRHAIVSIADRAGNIIYANDLFCEISGYRRDELLGQNHRIVKSGQHSPDFYHELWQRISSGQVWHGEICNRRKDGSHYWVESTITPFLDEDGLPYQYVSIRTDITAIKAAEIEQRALGALSVVLNEAAANLLAAGYDTLDAAIERALQDAGEHLAADRAYLFQLSDDGTHMSNTHEWCAPGIAPQKAILQNLKVHDFSWWWAQMQRGDWLSIPDVSAMPPDAAAMQAVFENLGIRAVCAYPLQRTGNTVGFMGFDQCATVRDWDACTLKLLGLLTGLIESALVRTAGERALAERQQFTQSILDSVGSNIAVLNSQNVIIAVNANWRRFALENARDSVQPAPNTDLGTNYLDVCTTSRCYAEAATGAVQEAVEGIRSVMSGLAPIFIMEYPCDAPTELRWFEMRVTPLGSERQGVVVAHTDITERRRAEQSAEAAKERLRRGQLYANIGTWEWNMVTGELFWTERIAPLFGYPAGDLETNYDNFMAAVHPDDRQAVIDAINACVELDVPYEIEHRVVWPDGTVRWLLERGAIQRDDEGKPLHMIGVVQDIDVRKRAELALAEREMQLRQAQQVAHLGSFDWNPVSGELDWSEEHFCLWGLTPHTVKPDYELFRKGIHPDDVARVEALLQHTLQMGNVYDCVHRVVWPDGSEHFIHGVGEVTRDAAGQVIRMTGMVQDVTKQVEFEQALIAAREAAERANQAKSEFLASMSHELRTPMNAIIGFSQLMEYDETLPEEHLDNVKEILKAGRHLLALINEVLDLAKVESGKIELSLEPVELFPVVEECLSLVASLAGKRNIRLSHQGTKDALVRADRTRLKQALLNLLSNAIKYNREGGSVHLDVQTKGSDRLSLRVIDTGMGIPASKLVELFQPFNRLDVENSEIEGTGIGLTITRRIVELMGGSVGVESEVGIGSTFWIDLPLEAPATLAMPVNGVSQTHAAPPLLARTTDHQTVLYIEDNPANLKLVAQMLDHVPHIDLLTAHTPALGIELALAHRPALILLDINLPGMNGYQVLDVLKNETGLKDTPVIAITANAMPRDIERGHFAGFADYLTKPLDIRHFLETIDRCLASKRNH